MRRTHYIRGDVMENMVDNNKGFQIFVNAFFVFLVFICVMPFILLISSSVTEESHLIKEGYGFIPKAVSWDAYKYLLVDSKAVVRGYMISIFQTIVGTLCNLIITTLLAYPLSRKDLPGRGVIAFIVFFTMLFYGGLVPSYMMWTQVFKINNTFWALILPNLMMGAFYVIMMRTYFTSNIPEALIDAAKIDGAGEVRILLQVVLPMSTPIIATLALLTGLNYWNDWLNGLYYVNKDSLYSIQVFLYQMLMKADFLRSSAASALPVGVKLPAVGIKMAVAVLGSVPMLIVYPFFQRYFVKGITIGSVKG